MASSINEDTFEFKNPARKSADSASPGNALEPAASNSDPQEITRAENDELEIALQFTFGRKMYSSLNAWAGILPWESLVVRSRKPSSSQFTIHALLPAHFLNLPPFWYGNHLRPEIRASSLVSQLQPTRPIETSCHERRNVALFPVIIPALGVANS